jgi:hypothetical protein
MLQGTIISDGNANATLNNGYTMPQDTVNVEPIPCEQCIPEEEEAKDFTTQFKALFDAFTEEIPNNNHEGKNAKGFFKKFSNYIGSKDFENAVNEKAEKYNVPPKQIAKNFFLKVLGIIGDILGIVVNTVCSIIDTAVSLLATLLHGTVSVIGKAGNGLVSVVTMNQTNAQVA